MIIRKEKPKKPKATTKHTCKYCGKVYPQSQMGQIGLDVWACRGCA